MPKHGPTKENTLADARIIIEGRLGAEPRYNSVNGKSVANLLVLAGRSKKNDDGTWENLSTTAYEVALWEQYAELANGLNPEKGSNVIVSGSVTGVDSYTGDNGEKLKVKVSADGLRVFPKKNAGGNNYGQQQSAQSFPAPTGFNQPPQQQNDPWASAGGNSGQQEVPF